MKGRKGNKRLAFAATIKSKSLAHFNARPIGARSQKRFSLSDYQHPLQINNKRSTQASSVESPSESLLPIDRTLGQMADTQLQAKPSEMDLIKFASQAHLWHWNRADKSHGYLVSEDQLEVCFHPQCNESAPAIRGSEPLPRNGNYYFYWEVIAFDKTWN